LWTPVDVSHWRILLPHEKELRMRIGSVFGIITAIAVSATAAVGTVQAQAPPAGPPRTAPAAADGEVRGVIVDAESNAPLRTASVAILSRADSSLISGAVTRPDGSFRIEGLRPGRYYLRVSTVGYGPQLSEEITIADANTRANVGSIRLSRAAIELEGVQVEVGRSTVVMAPDRNVYRARDIAPAGGNASDVLREVPSVHVDADGKVSLRGNENVVIQVNGRAAPLQGAQLAGYLQQLPAGMLDRVEVVPNPSARYDPDGMAGIINIVMRQDVDLGLSGGLTLAASTSERYNGSGNLAYQRGNLTVFSSYGYNSDDRQVSGINDLTRLSPLHAPLSFTEQVITGQTNNGGHNFSNSLDYRFNRRDVLSSTLLLNRRAWTDVSLNAYRELGADRTLRSRYDRLRDVGREGGMFDYTLAFKRTFEPQKHELSTEVRFHRNAEEANTTLWRQPLAENGQSAGARLEGEINESDAQTRRLTAQTDYTRTLAPRTKLETGYKGEGRWLDQDFTVLKDALGTGAWERTERSNAFDFTEQVHAVYGVLSHGIGKVELQGGLRAEYASRDFALAGAESFPYDYASLFPSAVLAYSPAEGTRLRASYSRRINRPSTNQLNPFPVFFNVQTMFLGNPALNPEYTDAIELSFQRSGRLGSVQLSPFYRHTTDIIRFIIDTNTIVDGRDVTTIGFQNLETGNSWGTDLNGTLRFGQKFNALGGLNVFKMVTEGGSGESAIASDALNWMARANGTYNFTPSTSVQASYLYRAPMNIERGRFASMSIVNLTLRHEVNQRSALGLRLEDPFETMRFHVEAGDDNIRQVTKQSFNTRAVHLSYQYTFGQAPRIRRPTQPVADTQPGFPQ
jgi:ferric enterobactin receptor